MCLTIGLRSLSGSHSTATFFKGFFFRLTEAFYYKRLFPFLTRFIFLTASSRPKVQHVFICAQSILLFLTWEDCIVGVASPFLVLLASHFVHFSSCQLYFENAVSVEIHSNSFTRTEAQTCRQKTLHNDFFALLVFLISRCYNSKTVAVKSFPSSNEALFQSIASIFIKNFCWHYFRCATAQLLYSETYVVERHFKLYWTISYHPCSPKSPYLCSHDPSHLLISKAAHRFQSLTFIATSCYI